MIVFPTSPKRLMCQMIEMGKYFDVVVEEGQEFSEWVQPDHKEYKMACCDCGLVHTMQFEVAKVTKDLGGGKVNVETVEDDSYVVLMRGKRNNRSTGQIRRHRNIKFV